jgi:tRNA1Val (adenine37-N6)-methyltransferase
MNNNDFLKFPTERIDDLICKGLKIIQDEESYCFSIDAVLLANFIKAGKKDKIIDLGTGSGVIPLLLSAKTEAAEIVGIEIQKAAAERASRSVFMNGQENKIKIIHGNLKNAPEIFGKESFSVVVTNPPYMKMDEGKISPYKEIAISRHEVLVTLSEVIETAIKLLCFKGKFYMVYRTLRLTDAIYQLKEHNLEPKLLRFIHPRSNEGSNLFLIMAQKGGGPGLKVLPPLVVYDEGHNYTKEILNIYFGEKSEK